MTDEPVTITIEKAHGVSTFGQVRPKRSDYECEKKSAAVDEILARIERGTSEKVDLHRNVASVRTDEKERV